MADSPTSSRVKNLLGRGGLDDAHRNSLNLARVTGAVEDMEEDNLDFYEDLLKSQKKTNDLLKHILKAMEKMEGGGTSVLELLGGATIFGKAGRLLKLAGGAGIAGGGALLRGGGRLIGGAGRLAGRAATSTASAARSLLHPRSSGLIEGGAKMLQTARNSVSGWMRAGTKSISGMYGMMRNNISRAGRYVTSVGSASLNSFRRAVGATLSSSFDTLSGLFSSTFGKITNVAKGLASKLTGVATVALFGYDQIQGARDAENLLGKSDLSFLDRANAGGAYAMNNFTFGAYDWLANKMGYKNAAELDYTARRGIMSLSLSDFMPGNGKNSRLNPHNWIKRDESLVTSPTTKAVDAANEVLRQEALKNLTQNSIGPDGSIANRTLEELKDIKDEIQLQTIEVTEADEEGRKDQKNANKTWLESLKNTLTNFFSKGADTTPGIDPKVYDNALSIEAQTTPGVQYGSTVEAPQTSVNAERKQTVLNRMLEDKATQVSAEAHRNGIASGNPVVRAPLPDVGTVSTSPSGGALGDRKHSAATSMFNAIMAPETGSPDVLNPAGFIRTRVTPANNAGRHSSAWGPTQMTRGYLREFQKRNAGTGNLTGDEETFLQKMIDQGSAMLKNPNDPTLGYGGTGYLGKTEEERKLYASIAQKSMVDLAKQHKTFGSFIKSYRGASDSPYFRKVEQTLAKSGLTAAEGFEQLRNMDVKDAGAWNEGPSYDFNKFSTLMNPENQGLSISLPEVLKQQNAYKNIPANELEQFQYWNSNPTANDPLHLASLDPKMRSVIERAREISDQPFVVGSGIRTKEQQKKAIEWGWSKTTDSDHLTGGAADLWPVDENGAITFDKNQQMRIVSAMEQAAKEQGIKLDVGARWKGFKDRPHFALNEPLTEGYNPVPINPADPYSGESQIPTQSVKTQSIHVPSTYDQREQQRMMQFGRVADAKNRAAVAESRGMMYPFGDINDSNSLKYGELIGKGIIEANKDQIKPPSFAPPAIDPTGMVPSADREPSNSDVSASQRNQTSMTRSIPDKSSIPHMDELKMMLADSSMLA